MMNEIQNQIESNSLYLFLQENNIKGKLVQSFDNLLLDAIYVKSLIWECKSKSICFVLVLLADDRIDTNLVVKALNAESRSDVCLASRSLAIEMSGYLLGCVPPLGHRTKMPIILDSALVSKVNEMSDDGLQMYICGGGGQVGFELLIDINEILNLDHSSVEEISDKSPMKRKSIESKIIKTLKTKFTENLKPSISQFRRAAMAGDNESLATIISHIGDKGVVKAMLNLPSAEGGKTALHLAAWRGNIENVRILLDYGADIDAISIGKGCYGKSAIFYAITRCRNDVVELLLSYGANVSIINNKGQSPRSLAVSHLSSDLIIKICQQENHDLDKWTNYRLSHSDGITYGDLDSRFIDKYIDLKTGKTIIVDKNDEFKCIDPSSFESRWRGNYSSMKKSKNTNIVTKEKTRVQVNDFNVEKNMVKLKTSTETIKDCIKFDDLVEFIEPGDPYQITLVNDVISFEKFKNCLKDKLSSGDSFNIGIDCEWKPCKDKNSNLASIIQVAILKYIYIFDLIEMPIETIESLYCEFKNMLEDIKVVKLGFDLKSDLEKIFATFLFYSLQNYHQIKVCNIIDLSKIIIQNNASKRKNCMSLSKISEQILGKSLNKSEQCSNWEERPLTPSQIEYAALDAAILPILYMKGHSLLSLELNIPVLQFFRAIRLLNVEQYDENEGKNSMFSDLKLLENLQANLKYNSRRFRDLKNININYNIWNDNYNINNIDSYIIVCSLTK